MPVVRAPKSLSDYIENPIAKALIGALMPSDPVEAAMDLAQPVMAAGRIGGKALGAAGRAVSENFKPKDLVPAIYAEGKIFTGNHHGEAIEKALKEGVLTPDWHPLDSGVHIDLFQLPDGSLIDRFEASKRFSVTASENIPGNKIEPSP